MATRPNFWNEGLKLIQTCPMCEAAYNPVEARVVGERDDSHLVHIQCKKCSNSILALVLVSPVGVSSVGVITDLTLNDVMRFRETTEVEMDDAIGIHAMLSDERAFLKALAA